jgi:hypothetical protein
MSAAAQVLIAAALCIWLGIPAHILGAACRLKLDQRQEARRRAEQGREVTPEWLALLAATEETPVYDRLVCESMEKAEGWA